MVSIKDIAKELGVSPSTVSFVLNGKEKEMRISEQLSNKIKKAAKEAGYQRNQVAVSLRTGKSKIIALMVDTISGSFFSSLARIIEQEAQSFGYRVIYCSMGSNIKESGGLVQLLRQYHVDGYLIIPTEEIRKDVRSLLERKSPLVLMDSYFPGIAAPHVLVDNYKGVSTGVQYLVDKGYRRIALVCNDVQMVQMQERKRGYKEALRRNGIRASNQLICETRFESPKEEVVDGITAFIQSRQPEAILFAANYLGVAGLESIKSLQLKIPENIAVVCFDDLDIFNLYPPGITSIRQPIEEIGKTAVHMLMEEIRQGAKKEKTQIQLEPKMMVRQSA